MIPFGVRLRLDFRPMRRFFLLMMMGIAGVFCPAIDASNYVVTDYATVQDAVTESFGGPVDLSTQTIKIDANQRARIERQLGSRWPVTSVEYKVVSKQGNRLGLALILDEVGKQYPITFCVTLGLKNDIRGISVLTYREPIGADIRKSRFKKQFLKKSTLDLDQLDDAIVPITGATLSSWAAVTVVKKALIIGALVQP